MNKLIAWHRLVVFEEKGGGEGGIDEVLYGSAHSYSVFIFAKKKKVTMLMLIKYQSHT